MNDFRLVIKPSLAKRMRELDMWDDTRHVENKPLPVPHNQHIVDWLAWQYHCGLQIEKREPWIDVAGP